MKKSLYIILIIFVTSCYTDNNKINKNLISVSILPQKYFIDQLAGNLLEVNVMIPPGANHATYEPTPKQLADISKSYMYLRMGEIIFEKVWMEKFLNNNTQIKIINLAEDIELIENSGHEHEHGDHHHDIDPHIWMAPKKVQKMVDNLHKNLLKYYPEYADTLNQNYTSFTSRISTLDSLYQQKTNALEQKNFIIFHPALTYMANDYGLNQISIELEGKEPSPVHLQKIIDEAKALDIKYIFVQQEFNKDNAKAIAKEINARIIEINPLGYNWEETMYDILKNL